MNNPIDKSNWRHFDRPDQPAWDLGAFTPQELARLLRARMRYQDGTLNEHDAVYMRLRFYRWLWEQGELDG
jgi:hypothetical protein